MREWGTKLPVGGTTRVAVALVWALTQLSCVLLPVRVAPGISGFVTDAESGAPVADALVVVRFDGRNGEILPDRDLLGHKEVRTDALGRFEVGAYIRPGLTVWPLHRSEARVVAVLGEGYRCPAPVAVPSSGEVHIRVQPAVDDLEQGDSCRPVPARRGEATEYMSAWRTLHPKRQDARMTDSERQTNRLIAARSVLGFGENCEGPVTDLALAPGGERVAYVTLGARRPEIRIAVMRAGGLVSTQAVTSFHPDPNRRLAWTSMSELVLWQPATRADRMVSPSVFAAAEIQVVWRENIANAPTAAIAFDDPPPVASVYDAPPPTGRPGYAPRTPLDPEDLNDEADALWLGRSFALSRTLDPETGLGGDRLRVVREDGEVYTVALPGEACGPVGRFGRPHYRISADGRTAVDLRFVNGGCHAVTIDLETGAWSAFDGANAAAHCREERRIPAAHLGVALRGYLRDVESAVADSGADPTAAYVLQIEPGGETWVETRNLGGEARSVRVPMFPVTTPLRRIDVSTVSSARPPNRAARIRRTLPEPL